MTFGADYGYCNGSIKFSELITSIGFNESFGIENFS